MAINMKVTGNELSAIKTALTKMKSRDGIEVEVMNELEAFRNNVPLQWGVNWCAMGTQEAADAVEFAKKLTKAAIIAQGLTARRLMEDWDMEETITDKASRMALINELIISFDIADTVNEVAQFVHSDIWDARP